MSDQTKGSVNAILLYFIFQFFLISLDCTEMNNIPFFNFVTIVGQYFLSQILRLWEWLQTELWLDTKYFVKIANFFGNCEVIRIFKKAFNS